LQGKSDQIHLFLNDINHINKKWGFFSPPVQKILDFCTAAAPPGDQRILAIPRRFG
jgi:hypothetical protein